MFFMGPLLSWDHPDDYSCLLTFVDLLYMLLLLSMDGKMRTSMLFKESLFIDLIYLLVVLSRTLYQATGKRTFPVPLLDPIPCSSYVSSTV